MIKKIFLIVFIFSLVYNCEKPPEAPKAEAKEPTSPTSVSQGVNVKLDTEKSQIKWIGTKLKGKHNGTIKISEGTVILSNQKVIGGNFTIDMNSIVVLDLTGKDKAKLEGHLKTGDFFETDKFPYSKFVITSVKDGENGEIMVTGNLEMKGITKSISFPAKVTFSEDKKSVTATANFNINRQEWGITYKGMADNAINDEVNLGLELFASL